MKAPQQKKAEDFSSAVLRLVPSPRYFAKCKLTYCSGVSVPAQVLTEVPGISRTTASATEQKEFTPVVFRVTGLAHTA